MKRLLFLLLTLAWGSLWAQDVVRDSTHIATDSIAVDDDDEPNVIGAKSSSRAGSGEANILGAPIYYDSTGRALGTGETSPRVVHLQNSLEDSQNSYENLKPMEVDNFNHFFLELQGIFRYQSAALGINFTYLPRNVGIYGSALFNGNKQYFSLGTALRLSSATCRTDWQLYGGLTLHHTLGYEAGIRIAETSHRDRRFAWNSLSTGWALYNGHHYFTIGLSLEVSALAAIFLFLL